MPSHVLSLMTVTRAEPYALPFLRALTSLARDLGAQFIIGCDNNAKGVLREDDGIGGLAIPVTSNGCIESVHDDVLSYCDAKYVLRLDDDERVSHAMCMWLANKEFTAAPHWKFPRANLWGAPNRYIVNPPLWPDHQTRLSVYHMAGGRNTIHCGSPYGGGQEAPVVLEHHKFLVKTADERRAIAARYDAISPGAGSCMLAFSVPEDHFTNGIVTAPLGLGEHRVEGEA